MIRGLGARPDSLDERDHDFRERLAHAAVPAAPVLRPIVYLAGIVDQGRLGTCVSAAIAQDVRCIHVAQLARRISLETAKRASRLGSVLYNAWWSRAFEHETAIDAGTTLRNGLRALDRRGICPEQAWPYDDDPGPGAEFRRMPGKAADRAAMDQALPVVYRRICETGTRRAEPVLAALDLGLAVLCAGPVDERFRLEAFDATRPYTPDATAPIGGHAQLIVDHDALRDGWRVCNSWGPSWGAGGLWCGSQEWLGALWDLWVLEHVPPYSDEEAA